MSQTICSIGTKNQVVIPLAVRKKMSSIKPGKKVSMYARDSHTIVMRVEDTDWLLSAYGSMKNKWKGKNIISKIQKERKEWDA